MIYLSERGIIMKTILRIFLPIIFLIFLLISCYEFLSIDQPEFADPNSTFEVPITVALTPEEEGGRGYFGIRLPIGWTVEDSISYSGVHNGTFIYSSAASASMDSLSNAPNGYYWCVCESDTVDSLHGGTVSLTPQIKTDNQTGTFFIDYMITDRFHGRPPGSHVVRSGSYPISVDAPTIATVANTNDSGDGSLRQALSTIGSSGEIVFDISYPATIILDTTLVIDRSVTITGPEQGDLTISGNNKSKIILINPHIDVNICNVILKDGKELEWHGGGGAINCNGSVLNLNKVTITHNNSHHGGGIFSENSTLVLTDVKITNNSAYARGGGICCYGDSVVSLTNVIIDSNSAQFGGGILSYSPLNMTDVIITNNSARADGGGIYCRGYSDHSLYNVKVKQNSAGRGGGVNLSGKNVFLKKVTISYNTARYVDEGGGGIFYTSSTNLIFDSEERCNVFLNTARAGNDISCGFGSDTMKIQSVVVDTFTVLNPTDVHAAPFNKYHFDILNGKVSQSSTDLYVSPDGDDNNSGIASSEALKTISLAIIKIIADSLNPRTIYLNDGIYRSSTSGEHFPLGLPNWVTLSGTSKENTILDAENGSNVFISRDNINVNRLENLTITRGSSSFGGGICCIDGTLYLTNIKICNNWGHLGGGIFCTDVTIYLSKVSIFNNTSEDMGGGIYCGDQSELNFDSAERCNIYLNTSACGPPNDLFKPDDGNIISVVVDTFTVMNPTNYHAAPIEQFTFDILNAIVTNISEESLNIPKEFTLSQNYPNPFNPSTKIEFTLPKPEEVKIKLYNTLGQRVEILLNQHMKAGYHEIEFFARNLSSGIYFYRIEAGEFQDVKKMILLK